MPVDLAPASSPPRTPNCEAHLNSEYLRLRAPIRRALPLLSRKRPFYARKGPLVWWLQGYGFRIGAFRRMLAARHQGDKDSGTIHPRHNALAGFLKSIECRNGDT